ncbi:MAG: bifunctional glutamate N-acetyltransferase/amino-acid acetyltransferase ArgJ [Candidatus Firestonebacteria bacterium]
MKFIKGGINTVSGVLSAAVSCGIKKKNKLDLAVMFSKVSANVSAVFTTNPVKSAPVKLNQKHIKNSKAQAIIVNSGNANACTGKKGMSDAIEMVTETAKCLNLKSSDVLVASTGIIGAFLPMNKILKGIKQVSNSLSCNSGSKVAKAIMTTDTIPKEIAVEFKINNKIVRLAGVAKGTGMIQPNLATMLCFLFTDLAIDSNLLKNALASSVQKSFNMITVDGDMSTNDSVFIMANGLAENKIITKKDDNFYKFSKALDTITISLAKMLVKDGEGSTKFVEITVKNAKSFQDAKKIAFSIANSKLVKTAIFGSDPNWGRILCAAGNAGVQFNPEKIELFLGNKSSKFIQVVKNGCAVEQKKTKKIFNNKEINIIVNLNLGKKSATVWTCDLTSKYIDINAHYHT